MSAKPSPTRMATRCPRGLSWEWGGTLCLLIS